MSLLLSILVLIVALEHLFIMWLEITVPSPRAARAFNISLEKLQQPEIRTLFANQGLYNGFLAAGLVWGLTLGDAGLSVKVFFLVCVLIAGMYGAATASRKNLFVQALPAAIGLALLLLA